ncbi:UNVERIFIED_CONTAM: hypothetical protein FKN15_064944 [Acipenser sinensis]
MSDTRAKKHFLDGNAERLFECLAFFLQNELVGAGKMLLAPVEGIHDNTIKVLTIEPIERLRGGRD